MNKEEFINKWKHQSGKGCGSAQFDLSKNLEKDLDELLNNLVDVSKYVPMQKCPKCDGQGSVSKPPYVAGDVTHWDGNGETFGHQCNVCNGAMIIPMHICEPESKEQP